MAGPLIGAVQVGAAQSEPRVTDRATETLEQGLGPGERNSANPSNNYAANKHEANSTMLADGTSAQNIGAGGTTPIYLMGVYIHTALAGTLTITGFVDPTGTAASLVIPVGAVGWAIQPGNARRLESGCTMTKSSASDDDKILVDWRPIL